MIAIARPGAQEVTPADAPVVSHEPRSTARRPRIGFLGVGWIGRQRMLSILEEDIADIVAVSDPDAEAAMRAAEACAGDTVVTSYEQLLASGLDGIVIATPSALHAEQAVAALERGASVFCQKPLARTLAETQRVVNVAQRNDRLLAVDLSYRHTAAMQAIHALVEGGALGDVFAADLVFHNAYGPDKPWFRDARLSGGGCCIDLGTHLLDLALWVMGNPAIGGATSYRYAGGSRVDEDSIEDYATATLEVSGERTIRLACSWNLSAGRDAVIEATFHGTDGGASLRNVNGSFTEFVADHFVGTQSRRLVEPPDEWGGRAAVAWARQLARDPSFDPRASELLALARAVDRIYDR